MHKRLAKHGFRGVDDEIGGLRRSFIAAAAENNRKFVLKERNKASGVSTTRSEVCDVVLLARECSDLLWKPRLSLCCILDICVSGLVFVAGGNWWTIGKLKRLFGSGFFVLDLRF